MRLDVFGEPIEEEHPKIDKLTLCRDDCIEWLLKSTNEDMEFRIYKTRSHIMIHVDKNPFNVR